MQRIISILTLRNLAVSNKRKRAFFLTTTLFIILLAIETSQLTIFTPGTFFAKLFQTFTISVSSYVALNCTRLFFVSRHRKRRGIDNEERDNFTVGVNAIVNAGTVLVTIIAAFGVFEIVWQNFLSSIALFAVALTIIFQDFIKNFLFGFAIMFSSDYEIGHYIQVGEFPKGVITNITFSSTQLKTETGDILFIPNAVVRSQPVVNFSKLKKRITTEFTLLRDQIDSVETLEQDLILFFEQTFPDLFEIDRCKLNIKGSTKDEVIFLFDAPSKNASLRLKADVNRAIQKFAVDRPVLTNRE